MLSKPNQNPVLPELVRFAGQYAGNGLTIEVRPLDQAGGLQLLWRWATGVSDAGVLGSLDDRLGLGYLCNSQPWLGASCLRLFEQDGITLAGEEASLRFKWVTPTLEGTQEAEFVSLSFAGSALTFRYEVHGYKLMKREWELTKVG
ncbi:MAG: hypothetical protein MUF18_21160 [Fimbriiglobus sp.]|jgi:hypothetical protein|nr:hypothetical protein [Fimbriiglobus sp.]